MNISELAMGTTLAATKFELTNFVIGAQDRPSRIIKQLALESELGSITLRSLLEIYAEETSRCNNCKIL